MASETRWADFAVRLMGWRWYICHAADGDGCIGPWPTMDDAEHALAGLRRVRPEAGEREAADKPCGRCNKLHVGPYCDDGRKSCSEHDYLGAVQPCADPFHFRLDGPTGALRCPKCGSHEKRPAVQPTQETACCDVCGGRMARIRGRYPGMDERVVCPTCLADQIYDAARAVQPTHAEEAGHGE